MLHLSLPISYLQKEQPEVPKYEIPKSGPAVRLEMCLGCSRSGGGNSLVLWKGQRLVPSLTDRSAVLERESVNTPVHVRCCLMSGGKVLV